MKYFLLFLAILSLQSCSVNNTTKMSVQKASVQHWSGGVYGRTGSNYYIDIKADSTWIPDSIYFKHAAYPLHHGGNTNAQYSYTKGKYSIRVSESRVEELWNPNKEQNKAKTNEIPEFDGIILVKMKRNNKTKGLIIKDLKHLESLNYP
jgi:hypothetical protein